MAGYGQYQSPSRETPFRMMCRIMSYVGMAFIAALMAAVLLSSAVSGVRNYAWLAQGKLVFDKSWAPGERAALEDLEHAIRFDNRQLFMAVDLSRWLGDEAGDHLQVAKARDAMMSHYGPMLEKRLRDVAAAGSFPKEARAAGDESCRAFGSLAMVAAHLGRWDAMRALVRHGCDVGAVSSGVYAGDNDALSLALKAKRLDQAEWLAANGAQVRPLLRYYDALDISTEVSQWLLDHGLPIDGEIADAQEARSWACWSEEVNLPIIRRLVEDGKMDANRHDGYTSMLRCAVCNGQLALVRYLLGQGADPLVSGGDYPILDDVFEYLADENFAGEIDEEAADKITAIVRLLLLYGADPVALPPDMKPDLQKKLRATYAAYGYGNGNAALHADEPFSKYAENE